MLVGFEAVTYNKVAIFSHMYMHTHTHTLTHTHIYIYAHTYTHRLACIYKPGVSEGLSMGRLGVFMFKAVSRKQSSRS